MTTIIKTILNKHVYISAIPPEIGENSQCIEKFNHCSMHLKFIYGMSVIPQFQVIHALVGYSFYMYNMSQI